MWATILDVNRDLVLITVGSLKFEQDGFTVTQFQNIADGIKSAQAQIRLLLLFFLGLHCFRLRRFSALFSWNHWYNYSIFSGITKIQIHVLSNLKIIVVNIFKQLYAYQIKRNGVHSAWDDNKLLSICIYMQLADDLLMSVSVKVWGVSLMLSDSSSFIFKSVRKSYKDELLVRSSF